MREYAAYQDYAQSGDIEAVAKLLGLGSLDVTRSLIDESWQERWGEVIRRGAS